MPIQYQQEATLAGQSGTMTTAINLISRAEAVLRNSQRPGITMGEVIQCTGRSTDMTLVNPLSNTYFTLSFDELRREFPEVDFENSILTVDFQFQPDKTRNPPRYPSDMVDELRGRGFSEQRIQALLEWEKGGPPPPDAVISNN
jgi:hypothetical protein